MIVLKDLITLGMENYEEALLDREKWKEVCIAEIDFKGPLRNNYF